MPYLVAFLWWPPDSTPEMVKIAIEAAKKFPPDDSLGEILVPNAIGSNKEGIISLNVSLVKEGKLEESINRARANINMFSSVPGLRYSIETWATLEEAYGSIGLTPPEP
ncbi:MAG: hypothetical protein ACXADU_18145 [Promethearchaeota archaeon]